MLIAILWPHRKQKDMIEQLIFITKKAKNETANQNSLIPLIYLKVRSKILTDL